MSRGLTVRGMTETNHQKPLVLLSFRFFLSDSGRDSPILDTDVHSHTTY